MTRISLLGFILATVLSAQIRPLHTRDLTRLSQPQIAEQLRTNDIIFIPVGAVETNGVEPSGRDYVYPLAYASIMAEEAKGLYLPGLVWSYPGTTSLASASIYVSPQSGTQFLKQLAHSLLRQGFRRQVYLSASHGPAPLTVGTMVREFFEETQVPILYINMDMILPRLSLDARQRERLLYGAHAITSRLEDLPLKGDYGSAVTQAPADIPENEGLRELGKLGFSGSLTLGSWISHSMAHGGTAALPATREEREAWGKEGTALIHKIVREMKIPEAMQALRKHDQFTQQWIVPHFSHRPAK
jgi:creatinine amidohydrolase